MINGLPADLIKAKNELTALKTAHLHGLGDILFFNHHTELAKSGSSYVQNGTLTLTVADDMPFPPIVQLLSISESDPTTITNGIGGYNLTVDSTSRQLVFDLRFYKSGSDPLEIAILSSARISDISYEAAV